MIEPTDVAFVDAGPYGLPIAAHLRLTVARLRIFGRPMQTWRDRIPNGMLPQGRRIRLESG